MYIQSTQNFGNIYKKLGKILENVYTKYTMRWSNDKLKQKRIQCS